MPFADYQRRPGGPVLAKEPRIGTFPGKLTLNRGRADRAGSAGRANHRDDARPQRVGQVPLALRN
jgi:hypothetical protein